MLFQAALSPGEVPKKFEIALVSRDRTSQSTQAEICDYLFQGFGITYFIDAILGKLKL